MSKYFRIRGIEEDEIFRNLFIDYYPSLISFALYYVGDKTIAEDLVQEVFVKLWETRERWSAVGDFSAYVYQMVRFKCFNYLRAEKIRNEATRSFTEEVDITEINNYIAEETFRLVMNSMEDLPPACRTVFSLTLEGYSAKEIAEKFVDITSKLSIIYREDRTRYSMQLIADILKKLSNENKISKKRIITYQQSL